jgi:hypothetical protein
VIRDGVDDRHDELLQPGFDTADVADELAALWMPETRVLPLTWSSAAAAGTA